VLKLTALGVGSSFLAANFPHKSYAQAKSDVDRSIEWAKTNLPNSTPEIIQAAAKEGKVSLLQLQIGNDDAVVGVIKKFNERYPFIKVDYTQQNTSQLMKKFNTEVAAKRGITDHVALPSNIAEVNGYIASGVISKFVISQDGAFPESTKKTGYWYAWMRQFALTVYRKGALTDEEKSLIRTVKGLGDPRFKGRLGISGITNSSVQSDCYVVMSEPGLTTWKALVANKPIPKSAGSALIDGLLAGEYDIGVFAGFGVPASALQSGAPIEFIVSSPHSVRFVPGGISAFAPNPNSAKLWQDWIMSREGQDAWTAAIGTFSVREDVANPTIVQEPWFFEDKSAQVAIDWDDYAKKQNEVVERYKHDIQGG
jgi:iron(III) transport system substrate-binding protein